MVSAIRTHFRNNWGKYTGGLMVTAIAGASTYGLYRKFSKPESREPVVSPWWGCYLDDTPEDLRTDNRFRDKNYNTGIWFVGNDGKPRTPDDELRYVLQDKDGKFVGQVISVNRKYDLDDAVSEDPIAKYMEDPKSVHKADTTKKDERLPSVESPGKEANILDVVINARIANTERELLSTEDLSTERLNEINSQLYELKTLKSRIESLEN